MGKTVKQISVFVENKAGSLVNITGALAAAGVDIRALSIADTADFGILRMIVDDSSHAMEVLRNASCIASVTEVLAVPISDTPGGLHRVLSLLAEENLFIEYSYAFLSRKENNAYVIVRVEDNDRAQSHLAQAGIFVAEADALT